MASRGVPPLSLQAQERERARLVTAFLAAVEGLSGPAVKVATDVDDAVINRLRCG